MAQQTATTQLQLVPDWPDRGTDRLLVAWDKPRIRALVASLGEGAQLQEDQTWDLLVSTGLDEATGDALDQWGELVGEQRGPLSDNDYRQFILARMLVNRSSGTVDELLEILDVATQPNAGVYHQDNLPAGFYLVVDRQQFMAEATRRRVARLLEDARPAGRHMTVIESLVQGFGFADDDSAEGYGTGPFSRLIRLAE
jgi:hypothetical protein